MRSTQSFGEPFWPKMAPRRLILGHPGGQKWLQNRTLRRLGVWTFRGGWGSELFVTAGATFRGGWGFAAAGGLDFSRRRGVWTFRGGWGLDFS